MKALAKKGEIVVCVDDSRYPHIKKAMTNYDNYVLTNNKSYEVLDIIDDIFYTIINDKGDTGNYTIERFQTKSNLRQDKIDSILSFLPQSHNVSKRQ